MISSNARLLAAFVLAAASALTLTAAPATVDLRLAELHPLDHPTAKADFEFARLVTERSGGRIRIAVYTDSVLGQEMAVLDQVQFGAIDIARVSLAAVAAYVPRLAALQMPYLYRDQEHMWKVLKGDIGKELLASVREAGFVGLGWFEAGARSFYCTRPLGSPRDLNGLRIRVQENQLLTETIAAFGATPRQMAFGEVYSALLTGLVDGAENNMPTYYTARHYQLVRFLTLTEHARVPEIIVGSEISFAGLSTADRELIARAALDTIDYQRTQWREYELLAERKVRESGVQIVAPTDLSAWRALAASVYARQNEDIRSLVARITAVK
jgi:tripartite ATP-independent transporter DctP family solute receptor